MKINNADEMWLGVLCAKMDRKYTVLWIPIIGVGFSFLLFVLHVYVKIFHYYHDQ